MAAGFSAPVVQLTDAEKEETTENGEFTLLFHLSAEMKIGQYKLGGELHRSLNLRGFVQVRELGFNWYAAKFEIQSDYDIAVGRTSSLLVFRRYQIEFYQWEPNFQPFLLDGDIVEGRVQQIPFEYCTDRLVSKIAVTACASLTSRVLMVDSKSSRFYFQSIGTNPCSRLPLQIQIADGGPLVGLSYSPAQRCYNCRGFGHFSRNCRGNRATSPSSVPTHAQVRRPLHPQPVPTADPRESETRPLHPQPVPMADPRESETHLDNTNPPEAHLDNTNPPEAHLDNTNPPETHEETTPMSPRSIPEIEMPPKGAINVEMGRESKPIVYNLLKEVSEINVTVNVTPLNDQRGNQRRITIDPRTDNAAPNCNKRVIYTSIDGAEDQDAIRMLIDKCCEGNISVAIVLVKSSVLHINNRIVWCLGFSASHSAEMTFPSFGSDGSSMDVQGNCLIMWKREEVRVDVSAVNTERHLKFSALWVVGESDEDSDGLSHGFTTTCGEEGPSDYSDSSESSSNGDTDSEVSSLYFTAAEELSNESDDESPILSSDADTLSPYYGDADTEESSFFSTSGEERSHEASTSSSTSSDSSIFHANGDTDSEGPSLFYSAENELSNESSSYSGSAKFDESPPLSPNSDFNLSPYAESDSEGSSFFSVSGGESSSESSTVSPNRDTNSEESSLSSTDAEEISYGSSAPCTSSEEGDESFILFPNGD